MDENTVGNIEVSFSEDNEDTHSLARAIDQAISTWCNENEIDYDLVDYNFNDGGNK